MNAKKLELIGLASLTAISIAAVGWATATRTGGANPSAHTNILVAASLISNAQASPMEHPDSTKPRVGVEKAEEQAPIYLDLGAKF